MSGKKFARADARFTQYFNGSRRSCRRGSIESYLSRASFEMWNGSPNPSECLLKRHVGAQLIADAGIRQERAKLQLNDLARFPDVTHI
jgi:hypothetical protein